MKYINHIVLEMRRQPVISIITLTGTAIATFLMMIVVMMQQVKVAPISPESNRDRFMHAQYICVNEGNSNYGSGEISYGYAQKIYGNLNDAEAMTVFQKATNRVSVSLHGKVPFVVDQRRTDAEFWKVFDFTFIGGKGFTESDMKSGRDVCVVSESVARKLFGTTDVVGRDLIFEHFTPTTIVGVVKDVSTGTSSAYAQIWQPLVLIDEIQTGNTYTYFGNVCALVLAKSKDSKQAIRNEVKHRIELLNAELKDYNKKIIDFGSPFPQDNLEALKWSNQAPDVDGNKHRRWIVYAILLLVPAVNLCSLTQSRLRRRMSEIGVRRAFGCTRKRIVLDLLFENFVVTIFGGLFGFILSVFFAWIAADLLFANQELANATTGITPMMLLNINVFFSALAFCFVLNLLTGLIPALRASRINPVEAINGRI